ncbi:MAG TPA: hypothetical protein VEZ89_01400 [Rubrivivax sp.]|nr:hypothetical protein [Rubrivivax sp.]
MTARLPQATPNASAYFSAAAPSITPGRSFAGEDHGRSKLPVATTTVPARIFHNSFDPQVAEQLRKHVYAAGNSVEPGAAYAAFRGREPSVVPLLGKRGVLPSSSPANRSRAAVSES